MPGFQVRRIGPLWLWKTDTRKPMQGVALSKLKAKASAEAALTRKALAAPSLHDAG